MLYIFPTTTRIAVRPHQWKQYNCKSCEKITATTTTKTDEEVTMQTASLTAFTTDPSFDNVTSESNKMENKSLTSPEENILQPSQEPLNDYDVNWKIGFTVVSGSFIIFSIIALFSLMKTKRTPENARFLSSGLISFDTMAILSFTVRKFMDNDSWNIGIHVMGIYFCFLAYITIGVMSLERLIIFNSPNFYLRHFEPYKVKRCMYIVWIVSSVVYFFTRYGACYIMVPNATMYDVLGTCNRVSFILFGATIVSVIFISLICYAKIFIIVKNEVQKSVKSKSLNFSSTARSMKQYKSTTLVFVYLIAVVVTGFGYSIVMLHGLNTKPRRLYLDAVNTFNCMIDPCIYVLWYRECRMEMLKLVSVCLPKLEGNIEKMRINVFEVVTSRRFSIRKRKNKTGIMPEDQVQHSNILTGTTATTATEFLSSSCTQEALS